MKNHRKTLTEKLRNRGMRKSASTLGRFVLDRIAEIELTEVTSSMALATLLAVVPVLALSLAVFSAFPTFEGTRQALENLIVGSLLPAEYSSVLIGYLKEFATHAAGLTTFGIIGLVVTALLVIDKLFITLNRIFKVRSQRPVSQRVLIFWALMTLGPVAIAISLTLTGKMAAIALEGVDAGTSTWIYNLGQMVLQSLCFAVIYQFVPNCRVQFTHALTGGIVVSVLGLVTRKIFSFYVTSGTLGSIYGAFVAVPVLILWIYVAWLLFFVGAAVTATIPRLTAGRFLDTYRPGNDFLTALVILRAFVELRREGLPPVLPLEDICDAGDISPEAAGRILVTLQGAGYVVPVDDGTKDDSWVLTADSLKVTLRGAFEAFVVNGGNSLVKQRPQTVKDPASPAGVLNGWWTSMISSDALNHSLMETLGALPVKTLAETSVKTEDTSSSENIVTEKSEGKS